MGYSLLTDKDANFQAMRRYTNQRDEKKHTIMKLPCCNVSIEILRPKDQYIECPKCFKKYYLSYSIANSKLYKE